MLIDSHAHVSPVWYEPVETLLCQMKRHDVARAVLTQMIGQADNRYQADCVRAHPGRFASVVWIDPAAPDAPRALARLADEGAAGVRLRPGARSPGDDPLAIWRAAEACGLPVSCVGNAEAFTTPAFADLLQAVPGLTVVLEHLGDTSKPMQTVADGELRYTVLRLARFNNVCLKVPGLGELAPRAPGALRDGPTFGGEAAALLEAAIAAFGAQRLMWGSDFPVVSSREGYGNALALVRECLLDHPAVVREAILGDTARRIFWKEI
ncbi:MULTISPECIES: amidohydrolase family protein [Cupriavidus]|uniref:L-fuconolactonase n=1 Tax=Cupriavidus pinatubonensis (strain JMP 134 / LMG 1197) TaxID=264198 RepID=Q46P09_CUPPJ|nr:MULTISPECIES: amidohydrolase family protein [Cupriavidus]TPQ44178.1 amidohydrolase [Cupriavidus pinatubonensis]